MMIRFDGMKAEEWRAMCTPINEVLPADERSRRGALYIGSWLASADTELLDSYEIRQIVAVLDSEMARIPPSNGRSAYNIPIADSVCADLRPYLEGACRCISDSLAKGNNVLVHCQQGISRSAAIVVAYLMREKGMGYDEALQAVRSKRLCVKPNAGFESTLRDWEKELRRKRPLIL
ncbi:phosphatases II [Sanghuangporus baumii]|uniref:protein-tyrosine-phosphatase n=1 Tax=Sanghuangporus baumii TaxID=108892 RepID=A0A9Q5HWM9_SANBA|nr:phosphatases II [Sanghuangporus baumii]